MKSSDPGRPSSRRGASGAWNRLKPVREDALESYGLPSKGETRLNDFKTQETFLNRITERYMKLCALNKTDLDSLFSAANPHPPATHLTQLSSLHISRHAPPPPPSTPPPALLGASALSAHELRTVLSALRKLREAVTSSGRADAFAQRAYSFAIRVALLCGDWASYAPALHALLYGLHARRPLEAGPLAEFAGYLVLDLACRVGDLAGARETKGRFGYADRRVEGLLQALVRGDWVGFWRVKRGVDGYQRAIVGMAEQGVRVHALKVIGKSYLTVERRWVEEAAGKEWEGLVADGVGWELEEGGRVVVRRAK
ncbi:hypothetical protein EJ07DRAFT_54071, partial [Lizonia empirigonia]